MSAGHGLVIGKFYPPHAGHALLIATAAEVCARVTVVVMASDVESIPLALRVAWLREIHAHRPHVTITGITDNLPVDYESDAIWRGHVELMLQAARAVTSEPIACVLSSEHYGDELARRIGARHVAVDPARALVPISATQVRAAPVAAWSYLAPCVRGFMAQRIVITGAESTGKTTLARELCERLCERGGAFAATQWVPEYGRELTYEKLAIARARAQLAGEAPPDMDGLVWQRDDFLRVCDEQNRREDRAAGSGGPVLICDTDALATAVWHARYLGAYDREVDERTREPRGRTYFVLHPDDVPFEQDGVRDGEHIRRWMTEQLVARLQATGQRWHWVRGDREERCTRSLALIDELLARGSALATPLG